MNIIHELSPVTTLPEFDVFAVPPTQTTVEKDVCYEYRPISTLDSRSTIEFFVESNPDKYINLRESFLLVKIQFSLSKADKLAVDDNDWKSVSVASYLLHSIFKHMDVFVGDRQINTSSTTYPFRAYIEALLMFDEEAKNTYLLSSGWLTDEIERTKLIAPNTADKNVGQIVELLERLHLDLTFQERAIIGGTTLRLNLVPHDLKFYIKTSDENLIPHVKFLEASWFIHKSKLSREVYEAQSKAISLAPARYPITRVEVKSFSVGKCSLDCSVENAIHGQLPRRLYICLVSNEAYNGSYKKDPFKFESFSVKFLCCYVNGMQFFC